MSIIEPYPEIEFRDGERVVPPHVAALLTGVETWNLTYDEAIALTNEQALRSRLNTIQKDTVRAHFRENR